MFLWLLCIGILLWITWFRFKRRRLYKMASLIPAPVEELPLIGLAHTLAGNTEDIMAALQKYSYSAMNNGGIIRGWLGHLLYFVFTDPVDLEMVLKSALEKDDLHRFIKKVIGNGGIFAPVPIWRKRRKIMIPAFTPKIVENFVEIFSRYSEQLSIKLDKCAGLGSFKLWPFLCTYTLDAVCETAMGTKINAQDNPDAPLLRALKTLLNLVCERIFKIWLQPDWLYKLFPQYKTHQAHVKVIHGFTDEVIRKRREEIKNKKSTQYKEDHNFDLSHYKNQSFLDLLIHFSGGENGYSNEELKEEILTLMVAGIDTSAVATGYTLKLLAKYPKVQEELFQELQTVFGDSKRPIMKDDFVNLTYLDRVVKESLRLFPPVPFIIRKVSENLCLPSGRVLPAGSGLVVSIWGLHRDPKYWGPDAECFDPDRFLPERFNLQHPCSYMPFSNGPRNCIGYQYALMSIKAAVAAIVKRYKVVGDPELGPVPHIKTKLDVMMKAVDDYEVALERRN